jgi:tetratricopeptide (TPR) repeat protein
LEKILERDPDNIRVRTERGELFLIENKFDDAESEFRQLIQIAPDHPAGYLRLGRLYMKQDAPDRALAVLQDGYRRNPGSDHLLAALVNQYRRRKAFDQAVRLCQGHLEHNPQSATANLFIARIRMSQGRYPAAETALHKAIALEPTWQAPHVALARLYIEQGKTQAALDNLKKAIAANPENPAAYLSLGNLYQQVDRVPEAVDTYKKVLAVHPDLWPAANNVAFLLAETATTSSDLITALNYAQRAQALRPDDAAVLDTLGWIYYKMGRPYQALAAVEKALSLAPAGAAPVMKYHLAKIYMELGREAAAAVNLASALESGTPFRGSEDARLLLARLRSAAQNSPEKGWGAD